MRRPLALLWLSLSLSVAPLAATAAAALEPDTLLAITGLAADDWFGVAVGAAGDVNGDGFADLIVGAYANDAAGADAGRAYVFYGGPISDRVPDLTFTGVMADYFGTAVGGAGDMNGDGHADVFVGSPANDRAASNAGSVYVYFGGPAADEVADLVLSGEAAEDYFGLAAAAAGDVNHDGFDDLVVGAWYHDAAGPNAGRVYLFLGGPTPDDRPDLVLDGESPHDNFGVAVAGAGDLDADGFADLVIGASLNDVRGSNAGRSYVYRGGSAPDSIPDLVLNGEAEYHNFGASVAGAGDVDGDGYGDLIIGATYAGSENQGRAYVFRGGAVFDSIPDQVFEGEARTDNFGSAVAGAGDWDGDGHADLIVGARGFDTSVANAGRAYLYLGGPSPDAAADLVFTGPAHLDNLGYAVASAGDVDGDGLADLIVGAPLGVDAGQRPGWVYVFSFDRTSPVLVSWFGGTPHDRGVEIEWQLASGSDASREGLERADAPIGPWRALALDIRREGERRVVIDTGVQPGLRYYYRLVCSDRDGRITVFGPIEVATGASVAHSGFALEISPNPSMGPSTIDFTMARRGTARLVVLDVQGREVVRLIDGELEPGRHHVAWGGEGEHGRVAAGAYLVRLESPWGRSSARMVLRR